MMAAWIIMEVMALDVNLMWPLFKGCGDLQLNEKVKEMNSLDPY